MNIEASDSDFSSSSFKMDGFISGSNYVAKKTTMVLFINGIHDLFNAWELESVYMVYKDAFSLLIGFVVINFER